MAKKLAPHTSVPPARTSVEMACHPVTSLPVDQVAVWADHLAAWAVAVALREWVDLQEWAALQEWVVAAVVVNAKVAKAVVAVAVCDHRPKKCPQSRTHLPGTPQRPKNPKLMHLPERPQRPKNPKLMHLPERPQRPDQVTFDQQHRLLQKLT
jgi:hypothetical protein